MRQTFSDLIISIGLLLFCAFATWRTMGIKAPPEETIAGASFFPWVMIGGIALLAVVLIGRALLRAKEAETIQLPDRATFLKMGLFMLLMIAYASAFMTLGYIPSTAIVFVVGLLLFKERRIPVLIVFPLVMTGAIYFSFTRILGVWLP